MHQRIGEFAFIEVFAEALLCGVLAKNLMDCGPSKKLRTHFSGL
jgi:hypothetical protein